MLNTQPGVGYSSGYLRVRPENVINKSLPTEYASTTNQSIHYQKTSRNKHCDRGPRQFTMDCRSAVRRSSRGGDHCRKGRYLRGVEIPDGQRLSCLDDCSVSGTYDLNTDKGEVGGSSPPRPTIQITSKYAVILTFPFFGDLPQKTVLSTVCQLYDWPDGSTLRALRLFR